MKPGWSKSPACVQCMGRVKVGLAGGLASCADDPTRSLAIRSSTLPRIARDVEQVYVDVQMMKVCQGLDRGCLVATVCCSISAYP